MLWHSVDPSSINCCPKQPHIVIIIFILYSYLFIIDSLVIKNPSHMLKELKIPFLIKSPVCNCLVKICQSIKTWLQLILNSYNLSVQGILKPLLTLFVFVLYYYFSTSFQLIEIVPGHRSFEKYVFIDSIFLLRSRLFSLATNFETKITAFARACVEHQHLF